MFEELNLEHERLVQTSHNKIKSYVSDHYLDAVDIQTSLRSLRQFAERKDVANVVLTLKELIPDYNPGSELLKTALSAKPDRVGPALVLEQVPAILVN